MTQDMLLPSDDSQSSVDESAALSVIERRGVENQGGFLTPYYLFELLGRQHEEELDPAGREPGRRLLKYAFRQAMRGWGENQQTLTQTWQLWYGTLFQALGFPGLRRLETPVETTRHGLVPISYAFFLNEQADSDPLLFVDLHPFGTDLDQASYLDPKARRTRWHAEADITREPLSRAIEFALDHNQTYWALLSNGSELRLYRKGGSIARQYLKIDFPALFDNDDDKEWLAFWGLFRLAAFLPASQNTQGAHKISDAAAQLCLLDRVIEESQRHATRIANDLRENMVRAVEVLLQGIIDSPVNRRLWRGELLGKRTPDEAQLKTLFKETIYLLYRLLFLLYAESRDLLPVGDSFIYRDAYSLEHLREVAERRIIRQEDYDKTYYIQTLRTLFDLLRNGFPQRNPALNDTPDQAKRLTTAAFVISAYNGQLFDPERTALLNDCHIPDRAMREVILELSLSHPKRRGERPERYSYADLGVDQLGSIYEGLLVYEPYIADEAMVDARVKNEIRLIPREQADDLELPYDLEAIKPAGSFLLRIWGGRRKGTGSYYTPQEITAFLVKNALAPLVEPIVEGCAQQDSKGKSLRSAEEIFRLKICDPAMGSGAFLIQACRYMGEAYGRALIAEGRIANERLTQDDLARYKRRVAEKCIYGVDLNPLAVELAKVSLWLETLARDRPLTFLDAHLRCGNALIGAPLRKGNSFDSSIISFLPTEAYSGISEVSLGEDKRRLNKLKAENRKQVSQLQAGQKTVFSSKEGQVVFAEYEHQRFLMEESDEDKNLEDAVKLVHRKQEMLQIIFSEDKSMVRRFKLLCDLWCAVWFWPSDSALLPPTTLLYHSLADIILQHPNEYVPHNADSYLQLAQMIAEYQRFFHWELEFPEIWCDVDGNIRPDGGFDVIVGNPPWDKIKPNEREFYSNYNPTIWNYQGTARKQLVAQLNEDPDIDRAWKQYENRLNAYLSLLFNGGIYQHQIAIVDGQQTGGDPDMFKFFTERTYHLLRIVGRAGIIVPHGIQSTKGCTALRRLLLDDCDLQVMCRLDNEKHIFSGVFHGQKFDLLVFAKGTHTQVIEAAFFNWEKAEVLNGFRNHPYFVQIEADLLRRLDTEQYMLIELHNRREVELVSRIYDEFPRLDEQLEDTWNVSLIGGMHMTNDNHLFREGVRLQRDFGGIRHQGRTWQTPSISWFDAQEKKYVKSERVVNSKGQVHFPEELDQKKVRYRHEGYLLKDEIGRRQALPVAADEIYYPLYEGRMVHQFDHAAKAYVSGNGRSAKWRELNFNEKEIIPHYFVADRNFPKHNFRAGFCGVTGLGNERSLLTAIIPSTSPSGNSVPTVLSIPDDPKIHLLWVALTNSFIADWLLRLRVSNNINFFILNSLAIPRPKVDHPTAQSLIQAAARLTCVTAEFASFWQTITDEVWKKDSGASNLQERAQLRAEIDARVANLYRLSEEDFAYILSTFPLVDSDQPTLPGEPKSFITRDLVGQLAIGLQKEREGGKLREKKEEGASNGKAEKRRTPRTDKGRAERAETSGESDE